MHIASTLHRYITMQTITSLLMVSGVLLLIVLMVDTVDLLRQFRNFPNVTTADIFQMALLKYPLIVLEILPMIVLFGTIHALWTLTRHHEMMIIRMTGLSVLAILKMPIAIAMLLGVFAIGVISPLSAIGITTYEHMSARLKNIDANIIALNNTGIWLRQHHDATSSILRANTIITDDRSIVLLGVSIFIYDAENNQPFTKRIDGTRAILHDGFWEIINAREQLPEQAARRVARMRVPTNLTSEEIQNNFSSPETLSFWTLGSFIDYLEESEFPSLRYALRYHTLLALPLMLVAMVILGAAFTLSHTPRKRISLIYIQSILYGVGIHYFANILLVLGQSTNIPLLLATWTPAVLSLMLGIIPFVLFHE